MFNYETFFFSRLLVQKQTINQCAIAFLCWQLTARIGFGTQKKLWQPKHVLAVATVGICGNSTVTKILPKHVLVAILEFCFLVSKMARGIHITGTKHSA